MKHLPLVMQIKYAGLPMPRTEYRFHPIRKWRFDLCWEDRKLAAEVDGATWVGGRHTRGKGFEKDCEKLNAALEDGWRVVRFTTTMVQDGRALQTLERLLTK